MMYRLALSVLLICCLALPISAADVQTGFEEWLGHNYDPIGGSIFGLQFGTTLNTDAYFGDINAEVTGGYDWYSMTSDNGKVSGDGEYFISGDMAAYVLDGDLKITITDARMAREVTVGVSNFFDVTLEAYDITGTIITEPTAVVSALPCTKTQPAGSPGTGLQYLTVSTAAPRIAFVILRGDSERYVVDNVSYTIPEPGALLALGTGLVGMLGMIGRRRRS